MPKNYRIKLELDTTQGTVVVWVDNDADRLIMELVDESVEYLFSREHCELLTGFMAEFMDGKEEK